MSQYYGVLTEDDEGNTVLARVFGNLKSSDKRVSILALFSAKEDADSFGEMFIPADKRKIAIVSVAITEIESKDIEIT